VLGYDQDWVNTNTIFTFSTQSHFGNGNIDTGRPKLYYCGMVNLLPLPKTTRWTDEEDCLGTDAVFDSTALPYPSD